MFLIEDNHPSYSKRWTNEVSDYFNKKPINMSIAKFSKEIFFNETFYVQTPVAKPNTKLLVKIVS